MLPASQCPRLVAEIRLYCYRKYLFSYTTTLTFVNSTRRNILRVFQMVRTISFIAEVYMYLTNYNFEFPQVVIRSSLSLPKEKKIVIEMLKISITCKSTKKRINIVFSLISLQRTLLIHFKIHERK